MSISSNCFSHSEGNLSDRVCFPVLCRIVPIGYSKTAKIETSHQRQLNPIQSQHNNWPGLILFADFAINAPARSKTVIYLDLPSFVTLCLIYVLSMAVRCGGCVETKTRFSWFKRLEIELNGKIKKQQKYLNVFKEVVLSILIHSLCKTYKFTNNYFTYKLYTFLNCLRVLISILISTNI